MLEALFFITVSFVLFVFMFFKMIKNNDTGYIIILTIEALGVFIDCVFLLNNINMNMVVKSIIYLMSIVLPSVIIFLEYKNINIMKYWKMFKINFYIYKKDYKKAKDMILAMIEKNNYDHDAHKKLAIIYEKEGGIRKSIDEYVQCIEIDKQDFDSYYKVSNLLVELDKKDEAIEMLNSLLKKKPDYIEATIDLGELLIEKERYKEAAGIYIDALKDNPLSYDLNYNLGIVYTMLNDFKSAKEYYEKAAEINAIDYNSKYSLGEIALLYKELEKAEQYFMEVINSEELSADAYFELAKINMIKRNKETAIKFANIAMEMDETRRMSNRIKKEPLFIPIMAKISIPFNLKDEKETKLSKKEKRVKEHLEQTSELTASLGYKNNKKKSKEFEEKDSQKIIDM